MFDVFHLPNELSMYAEKCTVVQFADDTQLLISGPKTHLSEMIFSLESELERILDWFSQNLLKINASKTQVIVFGNRAMLRDMPQVSVKVANTQVAETQTVKNLGLVMDKHLTFQPHIDQLTIKCTGILMGLLHASHVIPRSVLKIIVNALVMTMWLFLINNFLDNDLSMTQTTFSSYSKIESILY